MLANRLRISRFILLLLLALPWLSACSSRERGVAPATLLLPAEATLPSPAVQTVSLHTATPDVPDSGGTAAAAPVDQSGASPTTASPILPSAAVETAIPGEWVEVGDERYGFALATPCWWVVSPIPPEGLGGVMTLRNYDDAYFQANSIKGWWYGGDWPEGVMKLDLVVWEGFDPALGTLEAYQTSFDPSASQIVSAKELRIGEKEALLVEMRNLVNPNDANSHLYVFRLSPETLMLAAAAPDRALDAPDIQAMLGSLVLTADQPVSLPQQAASPALIPLPDACQLKP